MVATFPQLSIEIVAVERDMATNGLYTNRIEIERFVPLQGQIETRSEFPKELEALDVFEVSGKHTLLYTRGTVVPSQSGDDGFAGAAHYQTVFSRQFVCSCSDCNDDRYCMQALNIRSEKCETDYCKAQVVAGHKQPCRTCSLLVLDHEKSEKKTLAGDNRLGVNNNGTRCLLVIIVHLLSNTSCHHDVVAEVFRKRETKLKRTKENELVDLVSDEDQDSSSESGKSSDPTDALIKLHGAGGGHLSKPAKPAGPEHLCCECGRGPTCHR